MVSKVRVFRRKLPYSQSEVAEQIRQVGMLVEIETKEIATEILKYMLDENVRWMKGK
jgi:hypothetical protein